MDIRMGWAAISIEEMNHEDEGWVNGCVASTFCFLMFGRDSRTLRRIVVNCPCSQGF
jgi:hypothetical protein